MIQIKKQQDQYTFASILFVINNNLSLILLIMMTILLSLFALQPYYYILRTSQNTHFIKQTNKHQQIHTITHHNGQPELSISTLSSSLHPHLPTKVFPRDNYIIKRSMFSSSKVQTVSSSTLHSYRSIEDRLRPQSKPVPRSKQQTLQRMCELLTRKVKNRKCFTFQLLKQFLLFPDSSLASSNISVSKYDALLFSDQSLHTVLKIMETQLIARKIWAFINLKANRKQKQLEAFAQKTEQLTTKIIFFHKEESFNMIRQTAHHVQHAQHSQHTQTSKLSSHALINISINNSPLPDAAEKSIKFQVNLSKGTAESEREVLTSRRREQTEYCRVCCCHGCCCCVGTNDYNLWERIQYLNHLEQLMRIKERSCTLE